VIMLGGRPGLGGEGGGEGSSSGCFVGRGVAWRFREESHHGHNTTAKCK